jgi:hypothetical protein
MPIDLDDYVSDADDADSTIIWSCIVKTALSVELNERVATITVNDPEWNGTDTIIFTATDTSGASSADTTVFTVSGVNDHPVLSQAIPDTLAETGKAFTFVLDPNTFTDVDPGDALSLSASMSMGGSTPAWITFDPASATFSGTPAESDTGIIEVTVTATDDSSASVADIFNIEVRSYVGINPLLEGSEINLYPNPNNGSFVIEGHLSQMKEVVLEIFNETGKLIWNRKISNETGTLHESVDLGNAFKGLYLLRVRTKSGMINRRIVIAQ